MSGGKTAAFIRVEGVLVRRGVVAASAYFAAGAQGFGERALRLGQVALAGPLVGLIGQNDRALANRMTYLACRGLSEDRYLELADEYYAQHLWPSVLDGGRELLRRARREGHRIVLLSENLAPMVPRLVEALGGADEVICNRLELRSGRATGRLLDPVVGGHDTGRWAKTYALEHDLDLGASVAYGVHGPDLLLLASVGQPCAVNPDYTLRRAAEDAAWPIMDYRS